MVHGWYFTWIIPFAALTQNIGIRLVSVSSLVYFMLFYRQSLENYNCSLTITETLLLWLPFFMGYFLNRIKYLNSFISNQQNKLIR